MTCIIASTLLISVSAHLALKAYFRGGKRVKSNAFITAIVQTGPQREALNTVYLAELMRLSVDRPVRLHAFNPEEAKRRLLSSPVIKEASVNPAKNGVVHVDYTARQPVAWLYDFYNVALDEEACPFPVTPFFSPKNLPEIYLGLPATGLKWNQQLTGNEVDLAFELLSILTQPDLADQVNVRRIDVSRAFASSFGQREIVLVMEDTVILRQKGREVNFLFPRYLRLSSKYYTKELGNYLRLRPVLLEKDIAKIKFPENEEAVVTAAPKIIDFRVPNLAFIDEKTPREGL